MGAELALHPGLGSYLKRVETVNGLLGACLVSVETGELLVSLALTSPELLERLLGSARVLSAQQRGLGALGLGESLEDMVIAQREVYHVLRVLKARPDVCCVVALARKGSNLGMTRLQLVEAEALIGG